MIPLETPEVKLQPDAFGSLLRLWTCFCVLATALLCYFLIAVGLPGWTLAVGGVGMMVVAYFGCDVVIRRLPKPTVETNANPPIPRIRRASSSAILPSRSRNVSILHDTLSEEKSRRKRRPRLSIGQENSFRGVYATVECILVFNVVTEEAEEDHFDSTVFTTGICAWLGDVASLASLNNGRIEICTGGSIYLTFSSRKCTNDALRTAVYGIKVPEQAVFTNTAGVCKGEVLKGRVGTEMQSWPITMSGAGYIAEKLALACTPFLAKVLLAEVSIEALTRDFNFRQIDYTKFSTSFGTEQTPIYSVTEGEGVDADLSVLWLHLQCGDMKRGLDLVDNLGTGDKLTHAMKGRIKIVTEDNAEQYHAVLSMNTYDRVGHFLHRGQRFCNNQATKDMLEDATTNRRILFVVLMMEHNLTRKLREALACFSMTVERSNGTVESFCSTKLTARWVIHHSVSDPIACTQQLVKVFTSFRFGLGICIGQGDIVTHRGVVLAHSEARARAECLAMTSLRLRLVAIADAEVAALHNETEQPSPLPKGRPRNTTRSVVSTDANRSLWRPFCFHTEFLLPVRSSTETGLVQMGEDNHPLYMRAMSLLGERCWSSAKECMQQYNDISEEDYWSQVVYRACAAALIDEECGLRSSDDPLVLRVTHAGAQFVVNAGNHDADEMDIETTRDISTSVAVHTNQSIKTTIVPTTNPLSTIIDATQTKPHDSGQQSPHAIQWMLQDRHHVRKHLGFHGSDNKNDVQSKGRGLRLPELWNVFKFVCVCFECICTPSRAFSGDEDYSGSALAFLALGVVCDAAYIGDIVFNFSEPVMNNRGIRVTEKADIVQLYLKQWFVFDLIACLPWEIVWLPFFVQVYSQCPWTRVNRCINILRIPSLISAVQMSYFQDAHPIAIKLMTNLLLLTFALFFMSSLWGFVEEDGDCNLQYKAFFYESCSSKYFDVKSSLGYAGLSTAEKALKHMHWALRGFAGYGQKWPESDPQHLMCIGNVVVGIAIFATVIAYLQSSMKMTHNEIFLQRLDDVVAVTSHQRLDEKTIADILKYHRMLWSKTKQVYEGQFDDLKSELPSELTGELTFFANVPAYNRIHLLKRIRNPAFLTKLISLLTLRFGSPKELLLERGEAFSKRSSGVFFFSKGSAVVSIDGLEVEVIEEGGFWGEVSALLAVPQPADCRLQTYCEMFFLPASSMKYLLDEFPECTEMFVDAATKRREAIRDVMLEFDDDDTEDMVCFLPSPAKRTASICSLF